MKEHVYSLDIVQEMLQWEPTKKQRGNHQEGKGEKSSTEGSIGLEREAKRPATAGWETKIARGEKTGATTATSGEREADDRGSKGRATAATGESQIQEGK